MRPKRPMSPVCRFDLWDAEDQDFVLVVQRISFFREEGDIPLLWMRN